MANSIYFNNCIREIRHSVYGRDNRKPIADALEQSRSYYTKKVIKTAEKAIADVVEMDPELTRMEQKLQRAVGSFLPDPMETWYTYDYRDVKLLDIPDTNEKIMETVTDSLAVDVIEEADYLLTDSVDGDSVSIISGDDYIWNIPNPLKETHVHHGEDYSLVITRINGQ